MPYQPIGLGTPNNNDGDSLYAGGVKINSNFAEIYEALAGASGATIKVATGTAPASSTVLAWTSTLQKFVPVVVDCLRETGAVAGAQHSLFLTNNSGLSGMANNDLSSVANALVMRLEGRDMFTLRACSNTTTANTRGIMDFNMGNGTVTSLSIYTTGVVVRGFRGLEIWRHPNPDSGSPVKLLECNSSNTTGITLLQTPVLDLASTRPGVVDGSDSSNAIAHTGYVKLNVNARALSSTQITARRGLIATGSSLASNIAMNIDGIYHPKHIEGLIYNYNPTNSSLTLVTGAAAHWSYSTSGVAGIDSTSAIAVVASYTPIVRRFSTGWTPFYAADGSSPAIIDTTIQDNTWYYLYYLGCLQDYVQSGPGGATQQFYAGSSNVVVSSNRDIASVTTQLNNVSATATVSAAQRWAVVRRLGPIRTGTGGTVVPFNVKRIDHGGFEFYWGLQPNAQGDTTYTVTITTASQLRIFGSSDTFSLDSYNSTVLTTVPPIPGVTAHLTLRHTPSAGGALPQLYLYGQSWTINSNVSNPFPPFEVVRSMSTGIANLHNIQLPMTPDGCYIPDGTTFGSGILNVTTSTGAILRYVFQNPADGVSRPRITSSLLQITTTGFRLAR